MKLYAGFRADRKIEITEQFIQIVPTCRATSSIIDREKINNITGLSVGKVPNDIPNVSLIKIEQKKKRSKMLTHI